MYYLVTGGAGFIGSHVCDALLAAGHRVCVVDDLSTGKRGNLSPAIELIEGDCGDASLITPLVAKVDGVFHLAAIASVQKSLEQWEACSRVNQLATIALLEAIQKRSAPVPFVYASSAAVYGNPDASWLPLKEFSPLLPLSPYGADKLGSEIHASLARGLFGIPTLGLRFFNVYGSRQDPSSPYSGVISIFMDRMQKGEAVTIFGDGTQTRDFIHVSDVAACLMAAMRTLESGTLPDMSALNVCTGRAISIAELAQAVARACGVQAQIHLAPAREADILHSCGDASLLTKWLGVAPAASMAQGLQEIVEQGS